MSRSDPLILAVPKGRILKELFPLMAACDLVPEDAFFDANCRQLRFTTNHAGLDIIRVRSFDVATFVAFGAAQLGIVGRDVILEFDYPEIYAPIDLDIGHCRVCVAAPRTLAHDSDQWSHIRVATKYPRLTQAHFAARGVQAECIKLNGAMELAPNLGLCRRIVDLVSSGATLRANGLEEIETIVAVSSRLIVNRTAQKTRAEEIAQWTARFQTAVAERKNPL